MKSFGLALTVSLVSGASFLLPGSLLAGPLVGPVADQDQPPLVMAAYGDPPGAGRHHGGNRKSKVSKSATPGVSTTKGVSQEEADKQYRQKYGF